MSATRELLLRLGDCKVEPFIDNCCQYIKFPYVGINPTGINIEEGELLYGLVRCFKPKFMLETGTNVGVSTMYAALAMQDNGFGEIETLEYFKDMIPLAEENFRKVGLDHIIKVKYVDVKEYSTPKQIDFLWLDTELKTRFSEFEKFIPQVSNRGIVCIHDMPEIHAEGFGNVPESAMRLHRIEVGTTCGVTFFQKRIA